MGTVVGCAGLDQSPKPVTPSSNHRHRRRTSAMAILGKQPMRSLLFDFLRRPLLDINAIFQYYNGFHTALHWALTEHLYGVCEYILKGQNSHHYAEKLDVNKTNSEGSAALHYAICHGGPDLVRLLLER